MGEDLCVAEAASPWRAVVICCWDDEPIIISYRILAFFTASQKIRVFCRL